MTINQVFAIARSQLSGLSTVSEPDFRLEQAELDKSDNTWNLVVSYLVENTNKKESTNGGLLTSFKYYRMYKKVKVSEAGELIGFYMYNENE